MQFFNTTATAAILALALSAAGGGELGAKTPGAGDGPAELPPASFTGKQYVDSNGCVFLRAGYDGAVSWVPRMTRSRQMVCGQKPTLAAAAPVAAPEPAPKIVIAPPPARPVGKPIRPVAPKPVPPRPRAAPVPAAAAPGAAPIPPGYKVAWDDDRLNPRRGPRTAAGDAQMARLFEPDVVPMVPRGSRTVAPAAPAGLPGDGTADAGATRGRLSVATKSAPAVAPLAAAGGWVQVGAFGLAANAQATAARLKAAGLPVAIATSGKGDRTLRIVLAGPFASAAELRSGLAAVRRAGFGDAFVRP